MKSAVASRPGAAAGGGQVLAPDQEGQGPDGDWLDVMAMVVAMSMAWSPVSNVYAATAEEPADVHRQRRDLLCETV